MSVRIMSVWAVFVVMCLAGCGGGEKTYKVSGTVTFDGKPVESGTISFESAAGGAGVASSGITGGKYELQSKAGKKKVQITASRPLPGKEKEPTPPMESYIPVKYNTMTELTKEVSASAENRFDFDLKK
jgi:hypothetical protein